MTSKKAPRDIIIRAIWALTAPLDQMLNYFLQPEPKLKGIS